MITIILCTILAASGAAENITPDANGAIYKDQNTNTILSDIIINTPPQQMTGWPKAMGVHPNYKPTGVALVDLDNNGTLDVIAGSTDNVVYAWDYHGSYLTGWPVTLPAAVQSKLAIGDLDNNGDLEVVIAARNGYVYVYNHDGTAFSGWPQNANGVLGLISPALFDLDRNGDLEVIMVQMQSGQPGHVYVWHHNGSVYTGWPQNTDYLGVATAGVADIDNDALFEIVALSYRSVYVWDQNGTTEPGWPKLNVASGMSYAQPVLADLDGDSDLEILHSYYLNSQNYVGIYHHDASGFAGWPQTYPGPQTYTTPVTGDIDADGDLEIFGGGHYIGAPDLQARHHTGGIVSGWPVTCEMLECSPIVYDLDDDGAREVVNGDNLTAGNLWAYEGSGAVVTDWPASLTNSTGVNSAATGDVDNDGDIEIALVTMDGAVNLWTLSGVPYKGYLNDWGTYFHDAWNTGWFHPRAPVNLSAAGASDHIDLIWAKNSEPDIAGYNIYRSQTSGGPYTRINTVLVADTFYADFSASPGVLYYYCATAFIKALAESRLSNETSAMIGIAEAGGQSAGTAASVAAPNPFRSSIRFASNAGRIISVRILNSSGRVIAVTDDPQWAPDRSMPAGVYFAEIETPSGTEIKKIVKTR